jgi:SecD/SecF fusion protein
MKILIGLVAVAFIGTASFLGWKLYRQATRPSMDRLGGTVLIYEVDTDRLPDQYSAEEMASAIQRRLDPSESTGIGVRARGDNRFEISVPRVGDYAEHLRQVKELLGQVGLLEFRILANEEDDAEGIAVAQASLQDPRNAAELEKRARAGQPPPPPVKPHGIEPGFETKRDVLGRCTYSWVELSRSERKTIGLDNAARDDANPSSLWKLAEQARAKGQAFVATTGLGPARCLLYSRRCESSRLSKEERHDKAFDYFVLVRDPAAGKAVLGKELESVKEEQEPRGQPAVSIHLTSRGGDLFRELTSQNLPSGSERNQFHRHLAIILDGEVMTAPRLNSTIGRDAQITGSFTAKEVNQLVTILRAGALPAPLKPVPVVEMEREPVK